MFKVPYIYRAKVVKVKDGDTFIARVDLGFKVFHEIEIRMYGIDAPETRTRDKEEKRAGLASKKYLASLIGRKTVVLETIKTKSGEKKKTFTRYLAKVYCGPNNLDVCAEMVSSGYARVMTEKDLRERRKSGTNKR